MKTKIYVVPSTHWDREWILPFEKFRYKLVRLMDRLLEILEQNSEYKYFHFDGQTTVIDDYLAIRPENQERLVKLMREGRILIGPFKNMLDCLLPSGEAIVRNLQSGLKDCKKWGVKPHEFGYVCDVFGHNAQMPQIYANFDIEACLLLRGREGYEDNKFLWEGADGSTVLVHRANPDYTYADFFLVGRWPQEGKPVFDMERMAQDLKKHLDAEKERITGNCHFMIDGYDNLEPDERLPQFIAYLNERLPEYEFILSNFDDYNAECKKHYRKLKKHRGVIYDSAKAGMSSFLMKNVASSIVPMKQENMYLEDSLCFVAEPLDLFTELLREGKESDKGYYPPSPRAGFFDYAWEKVVVNQPHDTLGGTCSTATHLDNLNDYKRGRENVETALADTMYEITRRVKTDGKGTDGAFLLYNPSEIDVDGMTIVEVKVKSGVNFAEVDFYDVEGNLLPHVVLDKKTAIEQVALFQKMADYVEYDRFLIALPLKMQAYSYTVVTYSVPRCERDFAGGEWKFSRLDKVRRDYSSMRTGVATFDNGVLCVAVNQNGSLRVVDKQTGKTYNELFVFEDNAEVGEGWNHRNPTVDEMFSTASGNARLSVIADKKDLARFKVRHELWMPEIEVTDIMKGAFKREGEKKPFAFEVTYTLLAGSKRIDCEVSLLNTHKNHRLRVVLPTYLNADRFKTALPFGMQTWQVAQGEHTYDYEPYSATVPGQGLLTLRGGKDTFSVYTKGLYEFEVADREDRAVYVTLLRAFPKETFMLKSDLAQLQQPLRFEFAIDLQGGEDSRLIKRCRAYRTGVLSCAAEGEKGNMSPCGKIVSLSGNAVLSSLRFRDLITGKPTVRIYDVDGGSEGEIVLAKPLRKAYRAKMNGEILQEVKIVEGKLPYSLLSGEIATFILEF